MTITIEEPTLRPGERLVATLITPKGRSEHIIRMAASVQTTDELTWKAAMKFAKDAGGELPDRVEGVLLFATEEDGEFERDWYWTREQIAGLESYAWVQNFNDGTHLSGHEDYIVRVVLVRREEIGEAE